MRFNKRTILRTGDIVYCEETKQQGTVHFITDREDNKNYELVVSESNKIYFDNGSNIIISSIENIRLIRRVK